MSSDNINVFDRLINGSIGTVKLLNIRPNLLCSTIYVKFDDSKAGNYERQNFLEWNKGSVPITAKTKKFYLKREKSLSLLKESNSHWYVVMQLLSTSVKEVP